MFALIENGSVKLYPYTIWQLKDTLPNISFPTEPNDDVLQEFGMFRVFFSTQPTILSSQVLIEDTPVFSVDAQRWTQVWRVREMTDSEATQQFNNKAAQVREQRNENLKDSDWTQITDATADKAAWATYRQALRDATTQGGFPWAVTWPTPPVN